MTKHAWFNNDYEGKSLRYVYARTLKRFKKIIDDEKSTPEDVERIINMLTRLAKCKAELAKPENEYLIRLGIVEQNLGIGRKTLGEFNVKTG